MDSPARSMCMDIVGRHALGDDLYRVTIAANEKVRQPPDLDFDGMSVDNYLKNPVVMWAHDAVGRSPSGGLPIGRTTRLSKTRDGRIVADFEFLADDDFAQRVKNAWDQGFLRAASISWIPLESVPAGSGSWQDARSELLEWSIVSLPADPDALRESHRLMLDSFLLESSRNGEQAAQPAGEHPSSESDGGEDEGEAEEVYLLARTDYEDLKTALGLLQIAVRGVLPDGPRMEDVPPEREDDAEVVDSDLREIQATVGAIRSAVRTP